MSRVLIAGFPARLATWLAQRLPGVTVEVAWQADDVLGQLRTGSWQLLVLDSAVEGLAVETVVRRLREQPGTASMPIFVALSAEASADPDRLQRLAGELRVERILLHPLDRGELARHAEAVVARQPRPAGAAAQLADNSQDLSCLWSRGHRSGDRQKAKRGALVGAPRWRLAGVN